MKLKIAFLIISLCITGYFSKAQLSHGGRPLSFKESKLKRLSTYDLPSFDYQKMMEEDLMESREKPFRYGKIHQVELSPENSGSWQTVSGGYRIWQLQIKSDNAFSLSLISSQFKLNKGVQLFIYSADRNQIIGAFTYENNLDNGYFSTVPIAGSEIILELDLEPDVDYGLFKINSIVHDYKNILKSGYDSSGACNININCTEGANWQNDKRAVVKYTYQSGSSTYLCTGALVNNTLQNGKPYILTAEHCVSNQSEASTAVFWFNYESADCISTSNPSHQSLVSSTLRATGVSLDFTLLEISSTPPSSYNVYYAGWSRDTTNVTNTVCIHHPQGDIKKISFDNEAPLFKDYGSDYLYRTHWNIAEWNKGTTESGSSGAPLFNQNHHIIGDLTGGYASCLYNQDDYFNRFDKAWDNFSASNRQLKTWLDPLNSGLMFLDGFDPMTQTNGLDALVNSVTQPNGTFCGETAMKPQVLLFNNGSVAISSLTVNYQIGGANVVSENWTGDLQPSQSILYSFNDANIPFGKSTFKTFVSSPNGGIDLKHSNDTLVANFNSQANIETVDILGDQYICVNSLNSKYTTDISGEYLWSVNGGTIQESNTADEISVIWNEWGLKTIDLNVTNLCNSVDATALDVKLVEQGIHFEIHTGENATEISGNISDCDGNLVYKFSGFSSNSVFSKSLGLSPGCYMLNLNSNNSVIDTFFISNLCSQDYVLFNKNFKGTYSESFTIESADATVDFRVYPNPATQSLYIEAAFEDLYKDATILVCDLSGRVVIPAQKLNDRIEITLNDIPKGIYLLKIESPRGEITRKIVKL